MTLSPDPSPEHAMSGPVRDSAGDRPPFLAFVADDQSETALRGGLLDVLGSMQIRRGTVTQAIKHLEHESTPRILVVDIEGASEPLEALDHLASVCTPDVKVLVTGDASDIGLYRELVRNMGVTEYLAKPLTRDSVAQVFGPHIAGSTANGPGSRGGRVIAVCGARGGVGATTIAVNLALQLADTTRGHVAILDLHLHRGASALMLGVKPPNGLRIALEQPDRVDALFLDRVATAIDGRLRLIAAEEPFDAPARPAPEGVRREVDLLRRKFNYIVVDLPVPGTEAEREALHIARHWIVVMMPDIASIRDAERLRRLVGVITGANRTTVVVNRANMSGGLKPSFIERGLGGKPQLVIPDFGKQLARAANLGKPALAYSSAFQRALLPLTHEISEFNARSGSRRSSRSWFAKVLRR